MTYWQQPKPRPAGVPATCRLPAETLARVEVIAPLAGMTKSGYIASAVIERVARDLERLAGQVKTDNGEEINGFQRIPGQPRLAAAPRS